MPIKHISIGQVKRDISNLDIVQDHELSEQLVIENRQARWVAWQQASEALANEILIRRHGDSIDVDQLWQATRSELEERGGSGIL